MSRYIDIHNKDGPPGGIPTREHTIIDTQTEGTMMVMEMTAGGAGDRNIAQRIVQGAVQRILRAAPTLADAIHATYELLDQATKDSFGENVEIIAANFDSLAQGRFTGTAG